MRRTRLSLFAGLGLAAVIGVASCVSETTAPTPPPSQSLLGGTLSKVTATLMLCSPQPYAATSRTIGKAGGTIPMGPHVLTIPAGALGKNVVITGEVMSSYTNSVKLSPEGLKFAKGKPATLTMSYSNCLGKDLPLPKKVAYTTDDLELLKLLSSLDLAGSDKVSAQLDHFSRYAVAY
ncbi:MAG: hypothetical protein ACRENB_01310 [Gemmatimonadales bacterium]